MAVGHKVNAAKPRECSWSKKSPKSRREWTSLFVELCILVFSCLQWTHPFWPSISFPKCDWQASIFPISSHLNWECIYLSFVGSLPPVFFREHAYNFWPSLCSCPVSNTELIIVVSPFPSSCPGLCHFSPHPY